VKFTSPLESVKAGPIVQYNNMTVQCTQECDRQIFLCCGIKTLSQAVGTGSFKTQELEQKLIPILNFIPAWEGGGLPLATLYTIFVLVGPMSFDAADLWYERSKKLLGAGVCRGGGGVEKHRKILCGSVRISCW
jgi:hypothetical protein